MRQGKVAVNISKNFSHSCVFSSAAINMDKQTLLHTQRSKYKVTTTTATISCRLRGPCSQWVR